MEHLGLGPNECAVCAAFPEHNGSHYTLRGIWARLRYARLRPWGKTKWVELPGCFTADDQPVVATAHMTDYPGAHSIAPGCWLCEKSPDLEVSEGAASERQPETEETPEKVEEAVDEQIQAVEDSSISDENDEARAPEAKLMANKEDKGYLAWTDDGLRVAIRSMSANGAGPDVTELKEAVGTLNPPKGVVVTLTETLGAGEAWITVAARPGEQASLLIATGTVIDELVKSGVYEEVLISNQ